jgi:ribosome maturation protein SDO1
VLQILKKGEVQVGEKEREHDLSALRKEIATLVSEKCVDPATQRPYPVSMIEKAMDQAGYSVQQHKNAKSQVSECIRILQTQSDLPIQRARMRIKVSLPTADADKVKPQITKSADKVEKDETNENEWQAVRKLVIFIMCSRIAWLISCHDFLDHPHRSFTIQSHQ